jgi:hypothetical protein
LNACLFTNEALRPENTLSWERITEVAAHLNKSILRPELFIDKQSREKFVGRVEAVLR